MKKAAAKKTTNKKKVTKAPTSKSPKQKGSEFSLQSMPDPIGDKSTSVNHINSGPPLPPIVRITTFSADEWEDFIHEWGHSLKARYHTVMRCSGSGDMGRDVVAHTGKPSAGKPWDNYQCKHYDHPLRPSDVWIELGKLVYYTFKKEFTVPREYYFVSPHGVGTSLARLLENPEKLRSGLIEKWTKHCKPQISAAAPIPLAGQLLKYLKKFPFEIVSFLPVLKVIEQHRDTPWHIHRFGGGFPKRPTPASPPETIGEHELKYITELLNAYTDHSGKQIDQAALPSLPILDRHFLLSRASFYSAEALKQFSRDHLDENEYGRLQDEIENGIQETYLDSHDDGYQKVVEVTKAAVNLQITDHPLISVVQPPDRRGICHQLVDMQRLRWEEDHG